MNLHEEETTTRDLVKAVHNQDHEAFTSALNTLMSNKISAAVDAKRVEVAGKVFNNIDTKDS